MLFKRLYKVLRFVHNGSTIFGFNGGCVVLIHPTSLQINCHSARSRRIFLVHWKIYFVCYLGDSATPLRSVQNDAEVFRSVHNDEGFFHSVRNDGCCFERWMRFAYPPYLTGCRVKHGMTGEVIPIYSVIPTRSVIPAKAVM